MIKGSKQLNWTEIESNAIKFIDRWQTYGTGNEKSEGHQFVNEFLQVFGVDWLATPGVVEKRIEGEGFSDFIWYGKIIIEMKSRGADPDFKEATNQLIRYTSDLPKEQKPILWMACDFENFRVWNHADNWKVDFKLPKLRKHKKLFSLIAGLESSPVPRDKQAVNRLAAEKMANLHDELKSSGYEGKDLEIYLTRLLFCLFANDTDIFHQDSLQHYIEATAENGSDLNAYLTRLFHDLNKAEDNRRPPNPYLESNPRLSAKIDGSHFRYI
ncbi:MAG: hypothetical protein FWG02_03435, partial [Holophagaceae bacterium]|nr:hypothetical protein [Holophagaceae bacterium]